MEKNRVLNHSPSLFDSLGTKVLALQNFIINNSILKFLIQKYTENICIKMQKFTLKNACNAGKALAVMSVSWYCSNRAINSLLL